MDPRSPPAQGEHKNKHSGAGSHSVSPGGDCTGAGKGDRLCILVTAVLFECGGKLQVHEAQHMTLC